MKSIPKIRALIKFLLNDCGYNSWSVHQKIEQGLVFRPLSPFYSRLKMMSWADYYGSAMITLETLSGEFFFRA